MFLQAWLWVVMVHSVKIYLPRAPPWLWSENYLIWILWQAVYHINLNISWKERQSGDLTSSLECPAFVIFPAVYEPCMMNAILYSRNHFLRNCYLSSLSVCNEKKPLSFHIITLWSNERLAWLIGKLRRHREACMIKVVDGWCISGSCVHVEAWFSSQGERLAGLC